MMVLDNKEKRLKENVNYVLSNCKKIEIFLNKHYK